MSIALTGTSPWSLTYTDGTTPVTVTNTSTNPYTFLTGNLTNSGTSTAATTYTITALSDASSCTAISSNYAGSAVVTVNPVPTVNDPTDISACAGSNFVETTYTGAVSGTVYTWTNNNTSTGLAASGTGNIGEFAGTNATNAAIVSTVTVTPSYGSSPTCSGSPQTFTLTVNPKPVVLAQTATICTGSSFTVTPTNGGGYIIPVGGSGTHYTWSAPTAAGLTGMSTGSGVSSFSSGTLLNSTNAPITVVYTVTPTYDNSPVLCSGAAFTVTIIVNPTPDVTDPTDQVRCAGASSSVTFASPLNVSGTVYSWTNNNTSTGLAGSGTVNIASFTTANTTNAAIISTVTVTPSYVNAGLTCTGTAQTFTITVNPLPVVANQTISSLCSDVATGVN
ncbi:hypothetical protein EBS67_15625, partial [bacterium]|nr:hypothetical protein [bacterium]